MDPALFKAAMDGNLEVVENLSSDQLHIQLTPNKNTALHISAHFGRILCVKEILRNDPSLLGQLNVKGETPLHIAARQGHISVVRALIECARTLDGDLENGVVADKEMLRLANEDGDTALLMAVRKGNFKVVKMLIEEDREFPHPYNKAEETPLYLAAEKGLHKCVSVILETCTSPSPGGPSGRTGLHAAIVSHCEGSMADLLKWKEGLSKVADNKGWIPLHYAAYLNRVKMVEQLLDFDRSLAYCTTTDEDDKNTPFHIAASRGNVKVMGILQSKCPDCFEIVNSQGQNVLHIAVENKKDKVVEFILKHASFDSLMNQRDNNGNTPLHLLPISKCYFPKLLAHPRADQMVFNNDGKTPRDICHAKFKEYETTNLVAMTRAFKNKGARGRRGITTETSKANDKVDKAPEEMHIERIKKTCETKLIVAALIATVTFAAGFTLPDGYNGNEGPNKGMAVLTRKVAFQAFIVTDTLALMCSTYSVYIYFITASVEHLTKLQMYQRRAHYSILFAQTAMMLAFITGIYSVFPPPSVLSISLCVIGCLFILALRQENVVLYRFVTTNRM